MIILGKNTYFDNSYKGNANNLIIGAPGTGKSRSFVIPNLCEAKNESIVVLDAKGEIYDITHKMMEAKGYVVQVLDFDEPLKTQVCYNPLARCYNEEDVIKLSSLIVSDQKSKTADAFWPLSSQLLCNALISYLVKYCRAEQKNLASVMRLLSACHVDENNPDESKSPVDKMFDEVKEKDPDSWSLMQYMLLKNAAGKTQRSVIISLIAEFCSFMTPQITRMTCFDNLQIESFCEKKTILYVKCSDVDRSKDKLVSMFFMQLFARMFEIADSNEYHSLKRPVHVILDDMGSNVQIPNLDCVIACSRGRNISLSLILQSIGQLKKNYEDYTSILNSCNNIVFLGGSDIETCKEMSLRLNRPLEEVLYKEKNKIFVFEQGGNKPIITETYDMRSHKNYKLLEDNYKENKPRSNAPQKEELYEH